MSTSPVAFGKIAVLDNRNADAEGALAVSCTSGTVWTASSDAGQGRNAYYAVRYMTKPGATNINTPVAERTLGYNLYIDEGRSAIWFDGTSGTSLIRRTGTGTTQTVPIYGRVDGSGQFFATPGSYSDAVRVTLTY